MLLEEFENKQIILKIMKDSFCLSIWIDNIGLFLKVKIIKINDKHEDVVLYIMPHMKKKIIKQSLESLSEIQDKSKLIFSLTDLLSILLNILPEDPTIDSNNNRCLPSIYFSQSPMLRFTFYNIIFNIRERL
jgi:hypothetical protein